MTLHSIVKTLFLPRGLQHQKAATGSPLAAERFSREAGIPLRHAEEKWFLKKSR